MKDDGSRKKSKPGRFSEEREKPDDQMAGVEGGSPDDPRAKDPVEAPPSPGRRDEVRRSGVAKKEPDRDGESAPREGRPDADGPPKDRDEPGADQEDELWERLDRDSSES